MSDKKGKLRSQCDAAIEHLSKEIGGMRSGRASTALLESVSVDYYGSATPLVQLGMINAPEPRLLTIQVYDKGAVSSVEKAIQQSDLGLNPSADGNLIRIAIPALTADRRKELVKALHKMGEDTKVGIRNHRRDAIDELKAQEKSKEISEDALHGGMEDVQKVTDEYTKRVDAIIAAKEKDMMEV